MKHIKNDWIDRYLFDVVRRLPEKQRKDIEEELRTLIEDMLEELSGNGRTEEDNIKEVLSKLGEPAGLASKYRGSGQHLIGGEYYPFYMQVLKIVLICVAAGMGISAVVSALVPMDMGGTEGAMQYIGSNILNLAGIPEALLSAFGSVTLIFYLLERWQVKLKVESSDWTVESLPEIPAKKALISRGECITGIVFGVLGAILLVYVPQFLGAWVKNGSSGVVVIPLLSQAAWNSVLPFFLLTVFAGVAEDIVKLIVGKYTFLVMWVNIVVNVLDIICVLIIFKAHNIWNENFFLDYMRNNQGENFISATFSPLENESVLTNGIVSVMIVLFMLDIAVTVYRTLRYGNQTNKEA